MAYIDRADSSPLERIQLERTRVLRSMKRAAATSAATQESGSMSGAPPHQQERHSIHDDEMSAKTSFPADAAAVGIDSPPGMQRATVSTSRRHIFHVSPMAPSGTSSVAIGGAGLLAGARRALPPPGQSSAEQLESLSMNVLSHAPPPSAASLPRRRGFSPDVSLDVSFVFVCPFCRLL